MQDPVYNGYWAEVIVHSNKRGKYNGLKIVDDIKPYVVQEDMWVKVGDNVEAFTGANQTIGTLVLRFFEWAKMDVALNNISSWLTVDII
jgi:hypothetical protein